MEGIDRIGYTAFLIAHIRAGEGARPDPIFEDPFAKHFHHETSARAMESYERFPIFLAIIRTRTRWGDEVLTRALDQGTTQVVTLGAGFDSRPLRFARPGVTYYEVDRAELLTFKAQRLAAHGLGTGAVSIAADYTDPGFGDALVAAGLDPAQPTLVLWEGNTYYLSPERNRQVLGTLAAALERPRIAFDRYESAIIEGRSASPGLRSAVAVMRGIGAPWIGWIDDLPALAAEVGLEVEQDRRLLGLHADFLPQRDLGPDAGAEMHFSVLRR